MSEKIVTLNEEVIKGEIRELVRGSVEETLNNLLEAEADRLTRRHGMSSARIGRGIAAGITTGISQRHLEK